MSVDRYAGKPFLRLVECYILDQIGRLDVKQRTVLEGMEPKLRTTFNATGSWQSIVASRMEFDSAFDLAVRESWSRCLDRARALNEDANPEAFATSVADRVTGV
jgi:hypothetical protein